MIGSRWYSSEEFTATPAADKALQCCVPTRVLALPVRALSALAALCSKPHAQQCSAIQPEFGTDLKTISSPNTYLTNGDNQHSG